MSQQIDDLDREIIEHLTVDGRASASEIAQRIGKVSERTIRNRISVLLQSGRSSSARYPIRSSPNRAYTRTC